MIGINTDLHTHLRTYTQTAFDSRHVEKLAEITRQKLGPGGIVGLVNMIGKEGDDRNFELFSHVAGSCGRSVYRPKDGLVYIPKLDIFFLKGLEIDTLEGHLLGFFLPENSKIPAREPWQDTVRRIQDLGGISGTPHPYSPWGIAYNLLKKLREEEANELFQNVDFIEVLNGESRLTPGKNAQALEAYELVRKKRQVGAIGVSDSHSVMEVGNIYTTLYLPVSTKELFDNDKPSEKLKRAIINATPEVITCDNPIIPIIGALKHGIEIASSKLAQQQ